MSPAHPHIELRATCDNAKNSGDEKVASPLAATRLEWPKKNAQSLLLNTPRLRIHLRPLLPHAFNAIDGDAVSSKTGRRVLWGGNDVHRTYAQDQAFDRPAFQCPARIS